MSGWDAVKSALPAIATALGGPLAGLAVEVVGKAVGMSEPTQEKVKQVLSGMPPEEIAKLTIAENELKARLAQMGYDNIEKLAALEVQNADAVNQTIQVEAKSEKWQVYSWRPFIGFSFGINLIQCGVVTGICYIAAIFFGKADLLKELPSYVTAVSALNATALPILGVASWFRGKMQVEKATQ